MLFQTTKNILFETGSTRKLGSILNKEGLKRVLVVTDAGVRKAGIIDDAMQSMKQAGVEAHVFDGVVPDPTEKNATDATELAINHKVDTVVGFGGGSAMDVAKITAYLAKNPHTKISDIYGVGKCSGQRLPLIQIPTTAGTGSEVTPISVLVTESGLKQGVSSPELFADWAILDANTTLTLPKGPTAYSGVDAMVHAIEAYTNRFLKNDLSDHLARKALDTLSKNI